MLAFQQGLSLVELMIGVLLASLISAMALIVLLHQQHAWREQLAEQHLQEEGQLIVQQLQSEIAYAGASLGEPVPPLLSQASIHRHANVGHDVLTLRSEDVTDCLGRVLASSELVTNQYYVRLSTPEINGLYCRAFARGTWEEVELVRGVELFVVKVHAWLPELSRFAYFSPLELPAGAEPNFIEILLVLRHPEVQRQASGQQLYLDPWGKEWHLPRQGIYRYFFMRRELLNG